jgi:retron-type reverse transcriptase
MLFMLILKKTFDRVNHITLIKILKASGFGEPFLSWVSSYLTNRIHYVKVLDIKSEVNIIPSGVLQKGHLSPILFSLFINNIKHVIRNRRFLMFVDDLKNIF